MASLTFWTIYLLLGMKLQTLIVLSQNIKNGSIPIGQSLTASESQQFSSSWLSPYGDFAFGFRKTEPNNGFTLSIWFDKIPNKTIVWHAQDVKSTDGLVPTGSKITLTRDNGLLLSDPRGQRLWSSSLPSSNSSVSRGSIADAGNFDLFGEDSDVALWSSFNYPTDTLLPTQSIQLGGNLSSLQTETSFRKGRFRLRLGDDGDLQLLVLNSKTRSDNDVYFAYYKSNTIDPNPGIRLDFNQSGYMYVQRNNSRFYINQQDPVSSKDYYHRAVLHFDGVFAQYYHLKGQGDNVWEQAWAVPDNICQKSDSIGNLACGFNNVCSLGDNKRPNCRCPERFSLMNPSDEYGDCKPDFKMQTCENNIATDVNLYELIRVDRTNWPSGDYEKYNNYGDEKCRKACLNDCLCVAVVVGRDDVCWKKKFPLSFGQRDVNGNMDDLRNSYTLLKVSKSDADADVPLTRNIGKNRNWLTTVFAVLFGTSAFVNLIFLALCKRKNKLKKRQKQLASNAVELNLRVFTYRELATATGDFIEELGRGSFGIVYKGFVKVSGGSEVTVAVKKLDRVAQENDKEFNNEVKVIGQIHHKNLVKLIGFCNEGQSRLIVYEFLPQGTLAGFLFRRPRPKWEDRRRIAVEIARGILYLHEECSKQIIHCDIKPQNILLDEYYNPRISDFGLAKLLMMNQTHTLTNIRGTKGYVAAEWFRNSPITSKVDVYSYGVLLLEIVCCKKAVDLEDSVILIDWAYDCFRERKLKNLIVDDLEAIDNMEIVEKWVKIAIWCIQEEPGMRPNMRNVTQMLEGVTQVPDPPNPCPYSIFTCNESLNSLISS